VLTTRLAMLRVTKTREGGREGGREGWKIRGVGHVGC